MPRRDDDRSSHRSSRSSRSRNHRSRSRDRHRKRDRRARKSPDRRDKKSRRRSRSRSRSRSSSKSKSSSSRSPSPTPATAAKEGAIIPKQTEQAQDYRVITAEQARASNPKRTRFTDVAPASGGSSSGTSLSQQLAESKEQNKLLSQAMLTLMPLTGLAQAQNSSSLPPITSTLPAITAMNPMNPMTTMTPVGPGGGLLAMPQGVMPSAQALLSSTTDKQNTRAARRLFIGNLPTGIGLTGKMLLEFLNASLTAVGVTTQVPIFTCTFKPETKYCFVEFRSIADAATCETLLEGLSLGACQLKMARPKDFAGAPEGLEDYVVPIDAEVKGQIVAMGLDLTPAYVMSTGTAPALLAPPAPSQPVPAGTQTTVVRCMDMVTAQDLVENDDYEDLLADVTEECGKFGPLEQVKIPRPMSESTNAERGVGMIFLRYTSVEGAAAAISNLSGRVFNGKTIATTYFDEERFRLGNFA